MFSHPEGDGRFVPPALQVPQAHRSSAAFPLYSSIAAERYLTQLGLRTVRIRIDGVVGHIETDPRDLWRVVARRDEVLARLGELGLQRVTIDLETKVKDRTEPPAFS